MWIFLNNAFLSIVEDRDDKNRLLVRARLPDDIPRVFPTAEVFEKDHADYRYRALIPREEVATAISEQVRKIDYDNFKNSVSEDDRHDAYLGVWNVMYDLQERG